MSMSQELQELEEQEQKAAKRYQSTSDELMQLGEKYGLKPDDWKNVTYSRKEEQHQESMQKIRREKIAQKQRLWNEEYKKIAEGYKMSAEEIKKVIPHEDFVKDMSVNKAIELIKNTAKITETTAE